MSYSFNPFTGCLDDVGNGIAKDGTTVTTASIPFAEGASIAADKILQLGPSANNWLGFVSPDGLALIDDPATTDLQLTGRGVSFANGGAAHFAVDNQDQVIFEGSNVTFQSLASAFFPGGTYIDFAGNLRINPAGGAKTFTIDNASHYL